jgi:hypothetical protein
MEQRKRTQQMSKGIAAVAVAILLVTGVAVRAEEDKNTQIMLQAARSLTFSVKGNRAYLLIKRGTITTSEVAVIFGYGDNSAVCKDIAEAMTPQYPEVRKLYPDRNYECAPVY